LRANSPHPVVQAWSRQRAKKQSAAPLRRGAPPWDAKDKKARILSEPGPRRVIEWRGARLMRLPCPGASDPRDQAIRPVAGCCPEAVHPS
jgi:hypothetical protein